jgi:hypothetical protein
MPTQIIDDKIIVTKEFPISKLLQTFEVEETHYFFKEIKNEIKNEIIRDLKNEIISKMPVKSVWLDNTTLEIDRYSRDFADKAISEAFENKIKERIQNLLDREFKHIVQKQVQLAFENLVQPTIQNLVKNMVVFNHMQIGDMYDDHSLQISDAAQSGYENGLEQRRD